MAKKKPAEKIKGKKVPAAKPEMVDMGEKTNKMPGKTALFGLDKKPTANSKSPMKKKAPKKK